MACLLRGVQLKACHFKLEAQDGHARAGSFETARGTVRTPVFMPVGTKGSVKMMRPDRLKKIRAQIILGNTYHLYLRPGHDYIEKQYDSIHRFMHWNGPILTDSGGFQVFSLSGINKITDKGVEFRSHLDGSKHFFDPEHSMAIQKALGSDIVMAFDECPPLPNAKENILKAVERTFDWAKRCADYELKDHQYLFGIVQGGTDLEMRMHSLEQLKSLDMSAYAIGGLSVGEKNDEMRGLLENFTHLMPEERPRYLMGIGKPLDILHAIKSGVDMFDCVLPTRNARNGQALTSEGPINIKKAEYRSDMTPLDPTCSCDTCQNYEKAYLHHLYRAQEPLAGMLITEHNLAFYIQMVEQARQAIINGQFDDFYWSFYNKYEKR